MENENTVISAENEMVIELSAFEQKFVSLFLHLNNLSAVRNHLEISVEDAINYYRDPKIQDAIKFYKNLRLIKIYKRKMLSLEELGSILTNQITDFDVPLDSHLSPKEKLEASKLLIEVHKTIHSSTLNPSNIEAYDLNFDPKDLDIDQIKTLLTKVETESQSQSQTNMDENDVEEEIMCLESSEAMALRKLEFEKSKNEIQNRIKKLNELKEFNKN